MVGKQYISLVCLAILANISMAVADERVEHYISNADVLDVSSTLSVQSDAYTDANAGDLLYSSAWCEGEDGDGGHWIVFKGNSGDENKYKNVKIFVLGGYAKSRVLYFDNARPKTVNVSVVNQNDNLSIDGESKFVLEDKLGVQTLTIVTNRSFHLDELKIKIFIKDIYKGSKYDDMCITELKMIPVTNKVDSISDELREIEKEEKIYSDSIKKALDGDGAAITTIQRLAYGYYMLSAEGGEVLAESYMQLFLKYPEKFAYILSLQEDYIKTKIYKSILSPVSDMYSQDQIHEAASKALKSGVDEPYLNEIAGRMTGY